LGAAGAYGYHKGSNALIKNRIEKIKNNKNLTDAAKAEKIAKWEDGKISKSDAWLAKHLGKEGTIAKKVSGWAEKMSDKMNPTHAMGHKDWSKMVAKYEKMGYTSEKATEMARKKLSDGKIKAGAKKAGKWVAEKVKNNPRAAAAAAAGIAAAGVGAGAGYAHRKMKED
jgi:hypothetical protein